MKVEFYKNHVPKEGEKRIEGTVVDRVLSPMCISHKNPDGTETPHYTSATKYVIKGEDNVQYMRFAVECVVKEESIHFTGTAAYQKHVMSDAPVKWPGTTDVKYYSDKSVRTAVGKLCDYISTEVQGNIAEKKDDILNRLEEILKG